MFCPDTDRLAARRMAHFVIVDISLSGVGDWKTRFPHHNKGSRALPPEIRRGGAYAQHR